MGLTGPQRGFTSTELAAMDEQLKNRVTKLPYANFDTFDEQTGKGVPGAKDNVVGGSFYQPQSPVPDGFSLSPSTSPAQFDLGTILSILAGRGTTSGGGSYASFPNVGPSISTLWNALQQNSASSPLAAQLQRIAADARSTGSGAMADARRVLNNTPNRYGRMDVAPIDVAGNAMARYMQASGVGSDQVDAALAANRAEAQSTRNADRQMRNDLARSWRVGQDSRRADLASMGAGFQSQLANSIAAVRAALAQQQQARQSQLAQQILQMAMQGNYDLAKNGIDIGRFL